MNLAQQFEVLGQKQLAAQQGIELLKQAKHELLLSRSSADLWGSTAVLTSFIVIPLNCIVNAFELKAANSRFQALERLIYDQLSKSKPGLDEHTKTTLSLLKEAITNEPGRLG